MYLNRENIKKIADTLEKFKDVEVFELEQDSISGIGSVTTMYFAHKVNDVSGRFAVEISGEENW
jgi:hypothetical protein